MDVQIRDERTGGRPGAAAALHAGARRILSRAVRDGASPRARVTDATRDAAGAARLGIGGVRRYGAQLDQGDLRRRADPDRRAPEAGAVGDVDLACRRPRRARETDRLLQLAPAG